MSLLGQQWLSGYAVSSHGDISSACALIPSPTSLSLTLIRNCQRQLSSWPFLPCASYPSLYSSHLFPWRSISQWSESSALGTQRMCRVARCSDPRSVCSSQHSEPIG